MYIVWLVHRLSLILLSFFCLSVCLLILCCTVCIVVLSAVQGE